jgi:hypothetical protein
MEARSAPSGLDAKEGRVVSLYFLVPRAALNGFREQLGQNLSSQARRYLVSGPWPPYNFVSPPV